MAQMTSSSALASVDAVRDCEPLGQGHPVGNLPGHHGLGDASPFGNLLGRDFVGEVGGQQVSQRVEVCTGFAVPGYGTGVEGSAAGMAAAGVHGFPVVLTSFVGREQAVRQVAGLLEGYRRVTVTGPGGVGKTRLAGEVAGLVAGRLADGAWLAELALVRDPAQVARRWR